MMKFARRAVIGAAVLAMMTGTAVAQQYNRVMTVHNDTSATIMYLYSTNTSTNDWGSDILGADVIPSGEAIVVDFDDGSGTCHMDIRAEFDDGGEAELRNINVCAESDVVFTD